MQKNVILGRAQRYPGIQVKHWNLYLTWMSGCRCVTLRVPPNMTFRFLFLLHTPPNLPSIPTICCFGSCRSLTTASLIASPPQKQHQLLFASAVSGEGLDCTCLEMIKNNKSNYSSPKVGEVRWGVNLDKKS